MLHSLKLNLRHVHICFDLFIKMVVALHFWQGGKKSLHDCKIL